MKVTRFALEILIKDNKRSLSSKEIASYKHNEKLQPLNFQATIFITKTTRRICNKASLYTI